jgi:hypothetical protein
MRFERGKDPKKSIGIGLYSMHEFKNDEEAADFILKNLPQILGIDNTDDLPDDAFNLRSSPEYQILAKYTVDCIRTESRSLLFFPISYANPDDRLIWTVTSRFFQSRILKKTKEMAEEKGYIFLDK